MISFQIALKYIYIYDMSYSFKWNLNAKSDHRPKQSFGYVHYSYECTKFSFMYKYDATSNVSNHQKLQYYNILQVGSN